MNIREQHTWVDGENNCVHELRPSALAIRDGGHSEFFAIVNHAIHLNGQTIPDQFRAPIEAASVAEAFEKLPEAMKEGRRLRLIELQAQAEAMERAHRNQIILPSGQQLPPAGKPRTRVA